MTDLIFYIVGRGRAKRAALDGLCTISTSTIDLFKDLNIKFNISLSENLIEANSLIICGPLTREDEDFIRSFCRFKQKNGLPFRLIAFGTNSINGGAFSSISKGERYSVWSDFPPSFFIPGEPPCFNLLIKELLANQKNELEQDQVNL